jgi:tRNA(His) 5'-end guanylyltransferase
MKKYESVSDGYLMRRCPVIIRLDGRAFHTFTRRCEKPFDNKLIMAFIDATTEVLKDIQ